MTKKPAPEKTAITEDKKKRRKSWDRRKQPHIRAHMEVAKNHGLQGHRHTAFMIFWDCGGDWEKAEQWFEQPNVKAQNGDVWEGVWAATHGNGPLSCRAARYGAGPARQRRD